MINRPPIEVRHESSGWQTFVCPLPDHGYNNDPDRDSTSLKLLQAHQKIDAPVKFAAYDGSINRYFLLGEVPPSKRKSLPLKQTHGLIEEGLDCGISAFERIHMGIEAGQDWDYKQGKWEESRDKILEKIEGFLKESGREEWTRKEDKILITFDRENYFQKIEIHVNEKGGVYFQTLVTALIGEDMSYSPRKAILDFLLKINGRFRLARASILNQSIFLEVATKEDSITQTFIEHAINSLVVVFRFTILEVRALMNEDVAEVYLKAIGDDVPKNQ